MKRLIVAFIICIFLIGLIGCGSFQKNEQSKQKEIELRQEQQDSRNVPIP